MVRNTLISFFLLSITLFSQSKGAFVAKSDTFYVNAGNNYKISEPVIIPGTEQLTVGGKSLSLNSFRFNYSRGEFSLSDPSRFTPGDTLILIYRTVKLSLRESYSKHKILRMEIKGMKDSLRYVRVAGSSFTDEAIFGEGMKKSGTLVRGFTIGTNRDLSINSGLRLQLSGRLTDDIEIVAALTDENTPIQPEGNSERLEELDKVFIQIKHPFAEAVFGDYDLIEKTGVFTKLKRKLQGLKAEVNYKNQNASVAFASARGKFTTNQFTGADGVQGPYRLTGANNERDIIIIAGSERVYIDGIEMKRGENNDYVIEYANAELTFTPKRLITSASRITVDFEYTDRRYQRNFFGASGGAVLFNGKIDVKVNYFNESDDQNSPIDLILSDEDKAILSSAGDDRYAASRSGVSPAKPDSNGIVRGTYTKIDTVIDGRNYSYYRYDPGNPSALYNVIFSYVGSGKGDYKKISTGNFTFVGIGSGNYAPILFLPLPEKRQMGSVLIKGKPLDNISFSMELAGSVWDKNRFSEIDNYDNNGYASNISLEILPVEVSIGKLNFGKAGVSFRNRFIQNRFQSIDRINEIEFDRNYNITSNLNDDESLTEIGIKLIPSENINFDINYGALNKGEEFNSDRIFSELKINDTGWINGNFNLDYVSSQNGNITADWMRQNGRVEFLFRNLKPGLDYLYENKSETLNSDSLLSSSLRYLEVAPFLQLAKWHGLTFAAKISYREESYPFGGVITKESEALSHIYSFIYNPNKHLRTAFDFTFRDKKFTKEFAAQGKVNNQTILIRSSTRTNLFNRFIEGDVYYQTATERTSRLERVFVRVPVGSGNYIYLGDLNNNGIADESEFEQSIYDADYIATTIPTDELFPVITLKTNFRWRFNFAKIIKSKSFVGKIIKALSTETVLRIDEKSKEENLNKIYFMKPGALLNDSTTLQGSRLTQQDIYILKNNREISFRLRFRERKNLNQYSTGLSRSYYRLNNLRIKFKMVKEINNQTDVNFITDNNISPASTKRSRNVNTQEIISDLSYRPYKRIEIGFRLNVSRSEDNYPAKPTILDVNAQTLRITFSFLRKGRLRMELERNELLVNDDENFIPFELTKGNAVGKNYLLRINFDYRIANNLQTAVNYLGRKQGGGRIIHSFRAEVRAYF